VERRDRAVTLNELFETRYLPLITRTRKPKTVAEYERLARKFLLPKLGGIPLENIGLDLVEALHVSIPGLVQANRAIALLSGMLGYAVERRLLAHNPCRGLRRNKEKGKEFFYSREQTEKLLAIAEKSFRPAYRYIALELLTGCRPGELLDAAPSWRHGRVLRTPDGKTGARTIFLSPAAFAVLERCPVFPWPDGTYRYFPPGMSLRRAWERLCREAGVPRARLYDLRHTYASAALAAGQSLPVIGQLLGHRKAQTTMRYTHLAPEVGLEAAAAAAERMRK
jgi:integrase